MASPSILFIILAKLSLGLGVYSLPNSVRFALMPACITPIERDGLLNVLAAFLNHSCKRWARMLAERADSLSFQRKECGWTNW